MDINKLSLRAFYESNREEYIRRRHSGDKKLWDETYKWDLLPKANSELSAFEEVTSENIGAILSVFDKYKSNFAHWIDMDDLNLLLSKKNGYQVIKEIWKPNRENVATSINDANVVANMLFDKKYSPSTYAYLLAAQDCNTFPIYRDRVMTEAAKLSDIRAPGSLSQGEKYELFSQTINYLAGLMLNDKDNYADLEWHSAINGQDFLYVMTQYK